MAVDPDFWVLFATQLPALVAGFVALQRGLIVIGTTADRERAAWKERFEAESRRADTAVAERREAEERLDAFRDTMKANLDVLERSVELNERLAQRR